jgi:potassium-transporting ATPase KdpC subunit
MLLNLRRTVTFAVLAVGLVFAYAQLETGMPQLAFKSKADGSLTPTGSTLIGQNWTSPRWFHGRPNGTGPYAANPKEHVSGGDNPPEANGVPGGSGASNLGPRSSVLLDSTRELVQYWHRLGVDPTPDLVTTSGSGYDPDIARQDAIVQIPVVSRATGIARSVLRKLIDCETRGEQWGFLGSSNMVVLQLNEALAKLH